ncbi:MAG: YjfB family protein [Lachnospiraceae bacterium]|nr:YjfB family protein [Lachnospiraceae bacterium]
MDIAGLSMALSHIETNNQVGTALLSKAMDASEVMGAGIVEMIDAAAMERSVNPAVGANFDMYI